MLDLGQGAWEHCLECQPCVQLIMFVSLYSAATMQESVLGSHSSIRLKSNIEMSFFFTFSKQYASFLSCWKCDVC